MAFSEVHFYSKALGMDTSINVILPESQQGIGIQGEKTYPDTYPVLWLLHGRSDNHTTWMRRTSIERYAAPLGLAVVMPDGGYSRYLNMVHGQNYYDYIAEELPKVCRNIFPGISGERNDNYIAGLSMGGGGALYIGLRNPDRYCSVCMLSTGGVVPVETLWRKNTSVPLNRDIYGTEDMALLTDGPLDILKLIRTAPLTGTEMPQVFHVMGTGDERYIAGKAIRETFESIEGDPYRYQYREGPGRHEWYFWDYWIRKYLSTLPLWGKET